MVENFPKNYEKYVALMEQLEDKIPKTMSGFGSLHKASIADVALNAKTKELIALGIAITVRCDGCIAFHVHDALKSGATTQEITETVGVAILMGGGPSVIYGCEALEALNQYKTLKENE